MYVCIYICIYIYVCIYICIYIYIEPAVRVRHFHPQTKTNSEDEFPEDELPPEDDFFTNDLGEKHAYTQSLHACHICIPRPSKVQ